VKEVSAVEWQTRCGREGCGHERNKHGSVQDNYTGRCWGDVSVRVRGTTPTAIESLSTTVIQDCECTDFVPPSSNR
jgi:hypothetical protein